MVKVCCVKGCKSECYAGCNISFHSFPKNEEYRQKWQQLVQVNIRKHSAVCSRHFTPKDFEIRNSRNMLVPGAVPSIFPVPKEKQNMVMVNIQLARPNFGAGSSSPDDTGCSSPDMASSSSLHGARRLSPDGAHSSLPDSAGSSPGGARSSSPDDACSSAPYLSPIKIFCAMDQKSVAVQTTLNSFTLQTTEEALRRKVEFLTQRLRRRDAKIESMKEQIKLLTNNVTAKKLVK